MVVLEEISLPIFCRALITFNPLDCSIPDICFLKTTGSWKFFEVSYI